MYVLLISKKKKKKKIFIMVNFEKKDNGFRVSLMVLFCWWGLLCQALRTPVFYICDFLDL